MITHSIAFLAGVLCLYLVQQWRRRRKRKYDEDPDYMRMWENYR